MPFVRRLAPVSALLLLSALVPGCGGDDSDAGETPETPTTTTGTEPDEPIVREELAQATPANAPGQQLYLQRVIIQPGAQLPTHFHDGTQIAWIEEGTLTYDIVSGAVEVTRGDGAVESIVGPEQITLDAGDALTEIRDLVHFGANATHTPVVVLLAALLAEGAPLATPVPE